MITSKQIPNEVTQKVKELVVEMGFFGSPIRDFEAREIATAVINVWPGMEHQKHYFGDHGALLLPLTQENSNERE